MRYILSPPMLWKDLPIMSMTRDSYAKEVVKVAESAFYRNETVTCPHDGCSEKLTIVQLSMLSTRSLLCPIHGHIYQEQSNEPFSKLDWDGAKDRPDDEYSGFDWDDDETESEPETTDENKDQSED